MQAWEILFWLVVAYLAYRVLIFALRWRGDVKAGASVGTSSFYFEVKDRDAAPSNTRRTTTKPDANSK